MRVALASLVCGSVALFSAGCAVRVQPATVAVETPTVAVEGPAVEVDAPLIEGPGVVVADVEPPVVERQYVYDEGFPPGVYLYGGFYYYGGHRYDRDVFLHRVVEVNRREHRYGNVEENRRFGKRVEARHHEEFKRTAGKRPPERRPGPVRRPEHK